MHSRSTSALLDKPTNDTLSNDTVAPNPRALHQNNVTPSVTAATKTEKAKRLRLKKWKRAILSSARDHAGFGRTDLSRYIRTRTRSSKRKEQKDRGKAKEQRRIQQRKNRDNDEENYGRKGGKGNKAAAVAGADGNGGANGGNQVNRTCQCAMKKKCGTAENPHQWIENGRDLGGQWGACVGCPQPYKLRKVDLCSRCKAVRCPRSQTEYY